MRFTKMHGTGNDFVMVDARSAAARDWPKLAEAMCDRHFGIGADGLLVWTGSIDAPRMTVVNADGSVPEMCGNGLRCFAKHLFDLYLAGAAGVTVDTDAGRLACTAVRAGSGAVAAVAVAMGRPTFDPAAIPTTTAAPVIDERISIGDISLQVTAVGTGNPHLVTFDVVGPAVRLALAPRLAALPWLPHSANIAFAAALAPGPAGAPQWQLDVFERGCGWTLACGTGAVATVAAAVRTGRAAASAPVRLRLPGGWLDVAIEADGMATLTGPAVAVFRGAFDLAATAGVGSGGS